VREYARRPGAGARFAGIDSRANICNNIFMNILKYENFRVWFSSGYPTIYINGKDIKLHVYIWEKENGNKPKGYVIHHKDKDKNNYNLDNLILLKQSEHVRIHAGWIKENDTWVKKPCNKCKKILPLSDFYYAKTRQKEMNYCKNCHKNLMKDWNLLPKNIAKMYGYRKKYYEKNRAKIEARRRMVSGSQKKS
jgi:hypothetical protein